MKFLSFIFAIYILVLACVPCLCDDRVEASETAQAAAKNSPLHQQKKDDNCTPFCICAGCTAPAINQAKADITFIKPVAYLGNVSFIFYEQYFSSHNCHDIWQPPKLG